MIAPQSDDLLAALKECREHIGKLRAYDINYETNKIAPALSLSDRLEALILDLSGEAPVHDFRTGEYTWIKP